MATMHQTTDAQTPNFPLCGDLANFMSGLLDSILLREPIGQLFIAPANFFGLKIVHS
jgi:hypothetical protein